MSLLELFHRGDQDRFWRRVESYLELKRPHTAAAYRTALRDLCSYAGARYGQHHAAKLLLDIRPDTAIAYMAEYKQRRDRDGRPLAPATVRHRLSILRAFYALLTDARLIEQNPFKAIHISASQTKKREGAILTGEQVALLLDAPPVHTLDGCRDRAIMAALFGGALRRSELIPLRICDLNHSNGGWFLRLRETKDGADHLQALPAWAAVRVARWQAVRAAQEHDTRAALLVHTAGPKRAGRPLSDPKIYRIWQNYTQSLGIDATPHDARAWAITELLRAGYALDEVRRYSRHKSYGMLQVYDRRRHGVEQSIGRRLPEPG